MPAQRIPLSPAQLNWLSGQVELWRGAGIVADDQARAIVDLYHPNTRFSLARLVLGLGGAFFGVGLIWLVAANLESLSPAARFAVVAGLWLGFLVGAELLGTRRAHRGRFASPVVGSLRLIAALAFGGVVFQAAQSLQVPAYSPVLVGVWALGAFVHAYAVRSTSALQVGIVAAAVWVVLTVMRDFPTALAGVLAVQAYAMAGSGIAALHQLRAIDDPWHARAGDSWREVAALLGLGGLFVAALPVIKPGDVQWGAVLIALVAAGVTLAIAGLVLGRHRGRWEPALAIGIAAAATGLVVWESGTDPLNVSAADWAHAVSAVVVFIAAAAGVAVLGVLRDSWRLTALALFGVVVFTTVQAFAVFAPIIDGAWLFLLLGVVFLGTGYLFDRARRRLSAGLRDDDPGSGAPPAATPPGGQPGAGRTPGSRPGTAFPEAGPAGAGSQ